MFKLVRTAFLESLKVRFKEDSPTRYFLMRDFVLIHQAVNLVSGNTQVITGFSHSHDDDFFLVHKFHFM